MLVTAGATEAIAATLLALLDDGDEVVTFEPFYDSYGAMIALAGARHVTVPLRAPDFRPDLDELRAAVTDRTRVILINSPHNPTGAVLDREALELIVELAQMHDAIIVTDEVYEHLIFDACAHIPIARLPGPPSAPSPSPAAARPSAPPDGRSAGSSPPRDPSTRSSRSSSS